MASFRGILQTFSPLTSSHRELRRNVFSVPKLGRRLTSRLHGSLFNRPKSTSTGRLLLFLFNTTRTTSGPLLLA